MLHVSQVTVIIFTRLGDKIVIDAHVYDLRASRQRRHLLRVIASAMRAGFQIHLIPS